MKIIRLATVAALSTTILAGAATAVSANEVREVTTYGQVEFRSAGEEDGELEVVNPEPGGPDVEINPEVPGTTGPLSIVKAATMNFGTQVISNQDQTYSMIADRYDLTDGSGDTAYTSFAQVQDVRGTNAGWNLQVSLSDFTSNSQNNVLTGAQISLLDPRIDYPGNDSSNAPIAHSSELVLIPGAGAVSVMSAEEGKGAGVSSVVWGDLEDILAQDADEEIEVVENKAIQLAVPGTTAKDATTYTSTLTWELTTTPGEDGPGEGA